MSFSFNSDGITPTDNSGGGGGNDSINPKDTAGLIMLLDGEINSRNAQHDISVNGMQNLLFANLVNSTVTGAREVLNGSPTFTQNSCVLGGTCFYPDYNTNEMTIEFCVDLTTTDFSTQFITHRLSAGGYQIWICGSENEDEPHFINSVVFQAWTPDTTLAKSLAATYTSNQKIYFALTTKLNTANSTKLYINGELVTNPYYDKDYAASLGTTTTNLGLGGVCSPDVKSNLPTPSSPYGDGCFHAPFVKWYAFRKWARQLSAEEIKQNYENDKKRFG